MSEPDIRIAFGVLQGEVNGLKDRTSAIEKTMVGMDGKLDKIQEMIAERTGFVRGGLRVVAALGSALTLAAAWFSGMIHIGHG